MRVMKNNLFKETSIIDDLINLSMKNILVNIQKNEPFPKLIKA